MTTRWAMGSLLILVQGVLSTGCGGDGAEDEGSGGSGASAGTPSGGTGGTPSAGSGGTSGTGGTPVAGSGGTSGTGTDDPNCTNIRSNMPCSVEGTMCPSEICGLADSGTRSCNCTGGVWACTSCDFTGSWICDVAPPAAACPAEAADEVACVDAPTTCGPQGEEVCICWESPSDGVSWDCDRPPGCWM